MTLHSRLLAYGENGRVVDVPHGLRVLRLACLKDVCVVEQIGETGDPCGMLIWMGAEDAVYSCSLMVVDRPLRKEAVKPTFSR